MGLDIREHLDSGLYHGCDLPQIQGTADDLFQIGLRHGIETLEVHLLDVFSVHPAQLHHVEHGRALGDTVIIKFLYQLLQCEHLLVGLRRPAQKGHKIHHSLRQEALVHQILKGGMAAALGKLLVVFVRDQRTVNIDRYLPAKGVIETVILRGGGQVFISPYHVGDSHQMVVHHIGKVIGGKAIGLDQDHVVQLSIVHGDVSVKLVVEGGGAFPRVILTDHIGHAFFQVLFHFLPGKGQAVLIVLHDLLAVYGLLQGLQTLLGAEAVIGLTLLHQHLCILQIDPLGLTLRLYIGAAASVLVRSFIVDQSRFLKGPVDDVNGSLHLTFLVRILDTKEEISSLMLGDQIGIKRRSQVSHMHPPCGRGRVTCTNFHDLLLFVIFPFPLPISWYRRARTCSGPRSRSSQKRAPEPPFFPPPGSRRWRDSGSAAHNP